MKKFVNFTKEVQKEEAPVNAVGGGNVAGIGVGPQGEPGRKAIIKKMIKRKLLDVKNKK